MRTKISKRGRVSVPAEVLKKLQIGPDMQVEWIVEGDTARVHPAAFRPRQNFPWFWQERCGEATVERKKAGPARKWHLGVFLFLTPRHCLLFTLSTVQSAFASFLS
jgi:bifunctional DNA-binding transcriptional regulator/antitoxin component of YhaV-PrlF toxin-antitoxin module